MSALRPSYPTTHVFDELQAWLAMLDYEYKVKNFFESLARLGRPWPRQARIAAPRCPGHHPLAIQNRPFGATQLLELYDKCSFTGEAVKQSDLWLGAGAELTVC